MRWGRVAAVVGGWEASWWLRRRAVRKAVFRQAEKDARDSGRPLVVIGAPDSGMTRGPGCGDITVDLGTSKCPNFLKADITKTLPFKDDSATVFVSCVLEYVDDYDSAMRELRRVAGDHLFIVRVEPWTLAAYLYPGAKRRLSFSSGRVPAMKALP